MYKNRIKKIVRLLIVTVIAWSIMGSSSPAEASVLATTYTVRFTAKYVSGGGGTRSVYYIADEGTAHLLGTVSETSTGDFTFSVKFYDSIRVYVHLHDDMVYHEHLYINGNVVDSGDVGDDGLTYYTESHDTEAPTGKIVSPISGARITSCPLYVSADVADDKSGIDWVTYWAYYDGLWHQFGTDDSTSGKKGWSANWDCSKVADQDVKLQINAQDKAGNRGNILGGNLLITLAKNPSSKSDTKPPSGWITAPAAGATINTCPVTLKADTSDDLSGVAWVKFWADYDGAWHEVTPVSNNSGAWSASWDCNAVTNQSISLKVTAQDNAGNQANPLGDIIQITLANSQAALQNTITPTPTQTLTPTPTLTQTAQDVSTSAPTQTAEAATNTTVPKSVTVACPSFLIPMGAIGFFVIKRKFGLKKG